MLVLDGDSPAKTLAFAAGGTRLVAVRDKHADIWSMPAGEWLYHVGPFYSVQMVRTADHISGAVPAHGNFFFVCGERPLSVHALHDGKLVSTSPISDTAWGLISSPHGDRIVTAGARQGLAGYECTADGELRPIWSQELNETLDSFIGSGDRFVSHSGALTVRDTATGQTLKEFRCPSNPVYCSAASLDGSRFAVGSSNLYVWNASTWEKPIRIKSDSGQSFVSFALHPIWPIIAAIQHGQTLVKFLDENTGNRVAKFQWKLGELRSVAFSPDGTLAAAGAANGKIVVWDVDE